MKGDIYFSAKDVRTDRLGATSLLNATWYTRPALVPAMPRLDSRPPAHVRSLRAARSSEGVRLTWRPGSADSASYAIYRRDLAAGDWCADHDARNLVATVRSQTYVDTTAMPGHRYLYTLTALDRTWNESWPVPALVVR